MTSPSSTTRDAIWCAEHERWRDRCPPLPAHAEPYHDQPVRPSSEAITDPRPLFHEAIELLEKAVQHCSYDHYWEPMCGWKDITPWYVQRVTEVLAPLAKGSQ